MPIILAVAFSASAFAEEESTVTISSEKSASIVKNCNSIRLNLKNLQRNDARARTYFGAIYESFASKYLKPLNLRLINNDLDSPELTKLQTSFALARTKFSDDYIDYSKSLEELISINCALEPEDFYQKLTKTREKRAAVAKDIKVLNDYLIDSVKKTEALKKGLNK